MERKKESLIFTGLAYWGMDWFNEIPLLNAVGALTWEYPWWKARAPWLIFLFGYLYFFLVSFWVHDMESVKKQAIVVGGIYTFDLACIIVFSLILRWI